MISPPPYRSESPNLGEIVDAAMLQSMMDDFYELTHIPMSLIDLEGRVIVGAGWQDACTRFHRMNAETCANCVASDTVLTADILPGEARLYRCANGMWDAATPITAGGTRIGNLFTGQFFFDDETVDLEFFGAQAHRYGFDEREYLDAIKAVPRLNRTTVDTGLRFLTKLSNMISQLSFINMERARAEADFLAALDDQRILAEELATERGVLQAIMDNTDTHLAYLDPDFNFVAVNSAYAIGSGYEESELIGRNHFALFPNAENEGIFSRVRETGQPVEYLAKPFEFAGQPWRGVTYWDWRLTPVLDRDGGLQGFALSLQNVTRPVRQRAFSEAINRLNDEIHSNLDFSGILEQAVPGLAGAIGCEVVVAALRSPEGSWEIRETFGLAEEITGRMFEDDELPEAAKAAQLGHPVVVSHADDSRQSGGISEALGLRTVLVAPLSVQDLQLGAIVYGYLSGPGTFDEYAVDFAGKTATSLSLALNNSRLFHDAMHSSRLSGALAKVNEILLSALTMEDVVARLVGEVSEVAGADKSLVIRVDDDRYTITHVREVSSELVGTVRDASFYPAFALAALGRQPVLVDDNWNDPRTNKGFVIPNGLRAFQLLPLTTLGTVTHVLALAYDEPQSFDDEDHRSAERMAAAMSVALNNARLYENEHRIADRLQEALLALPAEVSGVEFAYAYHSASEVSRVGGDFYDVFEMGDNRVGITIGDVAGKGLDAAVLTSLAKNAIRAHASESGKSPSRILELTNNLVYGATESDSFVTILFAILDCRYGRLVYANAGHPAGAILRADGTQVRLTPSGPLLGAFEDVPFGETMVKLGFDDVLLLYTDGVIETRRADQLYGEERLFEFLRTSRDGDVKQVIQDVIADIMAFSDGRLSDDLAILAVKRAGSRVRQ